METSKKSWFVNEMQKNISVNYKNFSTEEDQQEYFKKEYPNAVVTSIVPDKYVEKGIQIDYTDENGNSRTDSESLIYLLPDKKAETSSDLSEPAK